MPRIEPISWDELKPRLRQMMQAGMESRAYTNPLPIIKGD